MFFIVDPTDSVPSRLCFTSVQASRCHHVSIGPPFQVLRPKLVKPAADGFEAQPQNHPSRGLRTNLANPYAHLARRDSPMSMRAQPSCPWLSSPPSARNASPWLRPTPSLTPVDAIFITHILFLFNVSDASRPWSDLGLLVIRYKPICPPFTASDPSSRTDFSLDLLHRLSATLAHPTPTHSQTKWHVAKHTQNNKKNTTPLVSH